MSYPERPINASLIFSEVLQGLPDVKTVVPLGLDAIAKIKLFAKDAPFAAYLVGYDPNNTCHGLVVAHELRFGRIYLSGLEVAQQVWDIRMALDTEWKPVVLWEVVKAYALCLSKPVPSRVSRTAGRLRTAQARLAANLSKEQ